MPQLTLEFVLLVAAFVALFWRAPDRWQPWLLAGGSSVFLLLWDWISFLVLVGLTAGIYYGAQARGGSRRRRWVAGLAVLVVVFVVVKGWASLGKMGVLPALVIPIGFGFYLLKLIHYWVETDLGEIEPHDFLSFYNYSLFFPTLLVGPIHRFEDFLRCERRRRWDAPLFSAGLERILYGYAKVIVGANWGVAHLLRGYLFAQVLPGTAPWVLAECLSYGLYLYFSFSGYSDIAIGIARTLGQDVGENFHHPFLQRSISDFWRSWHISLGDWCRSYIFTPTVAWCRRPTVAVLATMLTIGVWHEFTLRYVLWGIYHGTGLSLHRAYRQKIVPRLPSVEDRLLGTVLRGVATMATFSFVIVGFVITKNSSLQAMLEDVRTLLTGWIHG